MPRSKRPRRKESRLARIVLSTLGSLGDLHPYIAVGVELAALGHAPVIATHGIYRARVERAGVAFHAVRPDFDAFGDIDEAMRRAMDLHTGSRYVLDRFVLPYLRASYDDLLVACAGADLVVTHVLTFGASLAAETLGVPRVHSAVQPFAMFSAHDPMIVPAMPVLEWLSRTGTGPRRALWALARAASRGWFAPVDALRREVGLPRSRAHPLMRMWSPYLNLALFSPVFAPPQPDWPPHTEATGFPQWDRDEEGRGTSAPLRAFLDAGEPPVVFTLGSSAVYDAGTFYEESARAAAALGVRAVLLTGPEGRNVLARSAGDRVWVEAYAPHSEIFPRAAAIVHQGGIGTTGQALAAGRPMLVMPYSHDQPDNAARCRRLGIARVIPRGAYRAKRVARDLGALLADAGTRERAAGVGARVRAEHGGAAAARAIDALLRGGRLVRAVARP